nr:hypothetical protein CparaKRNrm1_p073 [Cryptomonas paramecium]
MDSCNIQMTVNSHREIILLKKGLLNETQISFIRNKINLIFKKNKKKSVYVFQKKINYILKFCVENFFFYIFLEIIIKVNFFSKIKVCSVGSFLNQTIRFVIKSFFYIYFKENIKILIRTTFDKINSKSISIVCFKKILEDSKGKLFIDTGLKIVEFDNMMFFFYEFFQNCLEIIRINLDNKHFTSYTIILNKTLQLFRLSDYFFRTSTCFHEQITRIFFLNGNFDLSVLYYFKQLKNILENKKKIIKEKFFFTLIFCLNFLQDKNFYNNLILLVINHPYDIEVGKKFSWISDYINFKRDRSLLYLQNILHIINSYSNFIIRVKRNLTFYRTEMISRQCKLFFISSISKISKKYFRNIEYWVHYFFSFKKFKGKFDGLRKVSYFSNYIY